MGVACSFGGEGVRQRRFSPGRGSPPPEETLRRDTSLWPPRHLENVLRTTSRSRAPGMVPPCTRRGRAARRSEKFFEAPHLAVKRLSLQGNKALSSFKSRSSEAQFPVPRRRSTRSPLQPLTSLTVWGKSRSGIRRFPGRPSQGRQEVTNRTGPRTGRFHLRPVSMR